MLRIFLFVPGIAIARGVPTTNAKEQASSLRLRIQACDLI
jgi:hypothetical protein